MFVSIFKPLHVCAFDLLPSTVNTEVTLKASTSDRAFTVCNVVRRLFHLARRYLRAVYSDLSSNRIHQAFKLDPETITFSPFKSAFYTIIKEQGMTFKQSCNWFLKVAHVLNGGPFDEKPTRYVVLLVI